VFELHGAEMYDYLSELTNLSFLSCRHNLETENRIFTFLFKEQQCPTYAQVPGHFDPKARNSEMIKTSTVPG